MSHHCISPAFISAGLLRAPLLLLLVIAVERRRCSMCPTAMRVLQSLKRSEHRLRLKPFQLFVRVLSFKQVFHSCIATEVGMTSASHRRQLRVTSYQSKCLVDTWDKYNPVSCCLWHHTALYTKETATDKAPYFSTLSGRMVLRQCCQATNPIPASKQSEILFRATELQLNISKTRQKRKLLRYLVSGYHSD